MEDEDKNTNQDEDLENLSAKDILDRVNPQELESRWVAHLASAAGIGLLKATFEKKLKESLKSDDIGKRSFIFSEEFLEYSKRAGITLKDLMERYPQLQKTYISKIGESMRFHLSEGPGAMGRLTPSEIRDIPQELDFSKVALEELYSIAKNLQSTDYRKVSGAFERALTYSPQNGLVERIKNEEKKYRRKNPRVKFDEEFTIDGKKVEGKIRPLVERLNGITYIETVSSCEGHYSPFMLDGVNEPAHVKFNLDKRQISEFERLSAKILGKTSVEFAEYIVDLYKRHWVLPGDSRLNYNWGIEIKPFTEEMTPRDKRRVTDRAISQICEAIDEYTLENKLFVRRRDKR